MSFTAEGRAIKIESPVKVHTKYIKLSTCPSLLSIYRLKNDLIVDEWIYESPLTLSVIGDFPDQLVKVLNTFYFLYLGGQKSLFKIRPFCTSSPRGQSLCPGGQWDGCGGQRRGSAAHGVGPIPSWHVRSRSWYNFKLSKGINS